MKYRGHVEAVFKLAGFNDARARAARVFDLEMKIAAAHATRVESEDVHSAIPWSREELLKNAPGLDWPVVLEAGMADRLDAIGGSLVVRSTPGQGTSVEGTVPVNGVMGPVFDPAPSPA